jgi:hypothetical protein
MPNFDDLVWPDGSDNIGGTQVMHFYAPVVDFLNLPAITASPSTLAEMVTISTDITFKPARKFLKIYSTMDTGRVLDKLVGEFDGKSFEHAFEFFFPGTIAEALAIVTKFANSNMVFVAAEANGQKRIIGSRKFPAKLSVADVDTGAKTSERKGIKLKVESRGTTPAPIYTGVITLTPTIPD